MDDRTAHCGVCRGKVDLSFRGRILGKHTVSYFSCPRCGHLQTEEPFWIGEAYQQPLNVSDTGVLQRNLELSERVALIILAFFDPRGTFLDYAGGYGIFTRRMRDLGFNFLWTDPHAQNLMARGFEYDPIVHRVDVVTAFEVFEHFVHPMMEIDRLTHLAPGVIFSTELLPVDGLPPPTWWYYGFEHGQHISFYSKRTLEFIAAEVGMTLCSNGTNFHMLVKRKVPNSLFRFVISLRHVLPISIVPRALGSKTWADMIAFTR